MNTASVSLRVLFASATLSIVAGAADAEQFYRNTPLVSNGGLHARVFDRHLVNAWGIAFNPTGFAWVNSADGNVAVLYDGNGQPSPQPQRLIVAVPGPDASKGNPTGIVFSGGTDFVVSKGGVSGPARFIFATEQGNLAGWAPNVDINHAVFVPKGAQDTDESSYKGLALSGNGTTHLLYAANFLQRRIDVFDGTFKKVELPANRFVDPHVPSNFAPFGVQAINGDIYVTYAKQAEGGDEEAHGPGLGYVDVFDPDGRLIRRVATRGALNAPWGLALAPDSFGKFAGALLVGNFGDGTINAFARNGTLLGSLRGPDGNKLRIDGLWGLQFGNGILAQKTNALFYAAGPNDETSGLFGVITVAFQ
jgi:uncharacterized protein (TIGR03118 family)